MKKEKSPEASQPAKRSKDDPSKTLFERPAPWGLNVDGDNDTIDGNDWNGGSHVIEGILNILFTTLQNLPDNLLTRVVGEIILPEYLLVLCNHISSSVRFERFWDRIYNTSFSS